MRKSKRILSIFLSAALVLGLIGVPAFAATTLPMPGDMTIDWSVNAGDDYVLELNGYTLTGVWTIASGGTLTIQDTPGGGVFGATLENAGDLTITGGIFTNEVSTNGGTVTITGGTFVNDISKFLAPGYAADYNEETGTWTVREVNNVVSVADADGNEIGQYETLADAIAAAGTNQATVTLLADVTETVTIPEDAEITLDLSGFTLASSEKYVVTNNGTLTVQDSSADGTGTITGSQSASIANYGTVTMESGNIKSLYNLGGTATINGGTLTTPGSLTNSKGGNLTINGGTFVCGTNCLMVSGVGTVTTINGGDFTWTPYQGSKAIYVEDSILGTGAVTINGGTFHNMASTNPDVSFIAASICNDPDAISGKCAIEVNEDGSWEVGEPSVTVTIDGTVTNYVTLANAIKGAGTDTATITLLSDVTEDVEFPVGTNITLELNGKTLSSVKPGTTWYVYGTLTIQDSSDDQSGVVDAHVISNGDLTIDGGSFLDSRAKSGKLTINGGTFDVFGVADADATINGGIFTSRLTVSPGGNVTINGGTFTTNDVYGSNVQVWYGGELTITGGDFTATSKPPIIVRNAGGEIAAASISGGTYNKETVCDSMDCLDENCVVWYNGDGTWTVRTEPEYELYIDVQTAAKGADGNSNGALDVDPGETFTATLYLQNDMDEGLTVQGFDIYVEHDANLTRDDIRISDGVYANTEGSTETVTHIQSVATGHDITLDANARVALAAFTFTVSDGAEEEMPMLIGFAADSGSKTTHITLPEQSDAFLPAKKAVSVDVYQAYEVVFQDYTYAKPGDVLMIVAPGSSNVLNEGEGYTYNGEAMFYTEDPNYTGAISGAKAVYVYLIPADEMETAALNIGVGKVENEEIARDGDVNGDGAPMIADANAVYQLLLTSGNYYLNDPKIDVRARLEADVYTQWDGVPTTPRGTILDVAAIVDFVNGTGNGNG